MKQALKGRQNLRGPFRAWILRWARPKAVPWAGAPLVLRPISGQSAGQVPKSEIHRHPHACDEGIPGRMVAGGMHDVLQIGLYREPLRDLRAIGEFEHRLVIAAGVSRAALGCAEVAAVMLRADAEAGFVGVAARHEAEVVQAGFEVEVGHVAIARRRAGSGEKGQPLIVASIFPPKHLARGDVAAAVAAHGAVALPLREAAGVVKAADLVDASETVRNGRVFAV